ncbi:uncharacterized protein LOC133781398 [Humulus lupulus]|uniref:uncharacterized protein LOC133781398 n=1 Tax=Humulus lupulus TaxID=3486 RepID=UPI002B41028D|nr:uncharacterized protein LOC133781398 [Humulus lupulus]
MLSMQEGQKASSFVKGYGFCMTFRDPNGAVQWLHWLLNWKKTLFATVCKRKRKNKEVVFVVVLLRYKTFGLCMCNYKRNKKRERDCIFNAIDGGFFYRFGA